MKHPNCSSSADACRITQTSAPPVTLVAWTPVYDGNGAQTNTDPNTFVIERECSHCGRKWRISTQDGEARIEDLSGARA